MGMIFYGFYLDFCDLIKDVRVIQDILGLGKEQRPDKTLKIFELVQLIISRYNLRYRLCGINTKVIMNISINYF